jgi:FixJ family two-component response regulator
MISDIHPIIYLVDDDPSIRSSLSLLLESAGYDVICFKSANDLLKYGLDSLTSGCIILDVKMPGISGIELQKELTSHDFDIPIIFITGHGDIPMSVQAIKNGAVNFLAKPFEDNELLDAIDEALLRENESLGKKSEQDQIKREDELLRYLITGMLNKQIAYELNISERTVKAHRKQVLKKMGIQSIAELVRLTEKAGIKPIE